VFLVIRSSAATGSVRTHAPIDITRRLHSWDVSQALPAINALATPLVPDWLIVDHPGEPGFSVASWQ